MMEPDFRNLASDPECLVPIIDAVGRQDIWPD
jgi:hypothetical protein